MHYIAHPEICKVGKIFFRVLIAKMTKNTLKESLFLVENTVKIIISSHEMPKESCFNSDDSLSNKTFFYETVQYLQNLNCKTQNPNSDYGHLCHAPILLRSIIHLRKKRVFHIFLFWHHWPVFFLV